MKMYVSGDRDLGKYERQWLSWNCFEAFNSYFAVFPPLYIEKHHLLSCTLISATAFIKIFPRWHPTFLQWFAWFYTISEGNKVIYIKCTCTCFLNYPWYDKPLIPAIKSFNSPPPPPHCGAFRILLTTPPTTALPKIFRTSSHFWKWNGSWLNKLLN